MPAPATSVLPATMSDRAKAAVLAVAAILAIATIWTLLAEPAQICPGGDDYDPRCVRTWSPEVFFYGGIFPGIPCAATVGWLVGGLARWLERARPIVLATTAALVAWLPIGAACGTWPVHLPLWRLAPSAMFCSVVAALALERWTRRPPAIPVATARAPHSPVGL